MTQQNAIPQTLRYFFTAEGLVKRLCALPPPWRYRSLRWLVAGAVLCLALLAGALPARAADVWQAVGGAGFSVSSAEYPSLALDANNRPYVAYQDAGNSRKATVMRMKSDATGWEVVGSAGFSVGQADYTSLALDTTGRPYVAYQDYGKSSKVTVMRLKSDSTGWEVVGSIGFSAGNAIFISLALDATDRPYVAYRDQSSSSNKATVMRLKSDNTGWEVVGSAGFSVGSAAYVSLALDRNNRPYVVYRDNGGSSKAMVMRLKSNNTGWEVVGSAAFSVSSVDYTSLALDTNNRPYVVYRDGGSSNKATVMRLKSDNTGWEVVGNAGFSVSQANETSLALDASDRPYVVYSDYGSSNKATMMRLKSDNTGWEVVGNAGFSAGQTAYTSLALNSNDRPYVVYRDAGNGSKATVMQLLTAPSAPAAPTVAVSSGQVTVSWQAPTDNGGSAVLSYTATANPGGATCQATAPATSCVITGLTLGQTYTFSVTATNAQGTSLPSTLSATPTAASLTQKAVPTLNAWGLAVLALVLAGLGVLGAGAALTPSPSAKGRRR